MHRIVLKPNAIKRKNISIIQSKTEYLIINSSKNLCENIEENLIIGKLQEQMTFGKPHSGFSSTSFHCINCNSFCIVSQNRVRCAHRLSYCDSCWKELNASLYCAVCRGVYCVENCRSKNSCGHYTCSRCKFSCQDCMGSYCIGCIIRCSECIRASCPKCSKTCLTCKKESCLYCFKQKTSCGDEFNCDICNLEEGMESPKRRKIHYSTK